MPRPQRHEYQAWAHLGRPRRISPQEVADSVPPEVEKPSKLGAVRNGATKFAATQTALLRLANASNQEASDDGDTDDPDCCREKPPQSPLR